MGEETTQRDNAPLRSVFGPLSARVARIISLRPVLAGRLLCSPLRAVHAVAAYLHLAPDRSDDEIAQRLADTPPRDVLKAAMPGTDPRLYRALDRCGPSVLSKACYDRLAAIAGGPLMEVLCASDKALDAAYIRYVARLPEADVVVRRLPPRLLADQPVAEALIAVVALLRAYRPDVDAALARMPKAAGLDAIYRRLVTLLGALEAPSAARPLPPGVKQIMTVAGLRETGRSLGLCVKDAMHGGAEHWLRLVTGASIYVTHDEPHILIEMRHVAPDLWMVGEAKRAHNGMPPPGTMRALAASFVAAGWKLVDTDPVAALVTLACRSDSDFANWDRTLGQVLRELEHDWA